MLSEISIKFESADDALVLSRELMKRGLKVEGPYYLNKFGIRDRDNPLDVNRVGEYPGIVESQVEGGTNDD